MADRSLVTLLANGLAPRTKAAGMGMVTDFRGWLGGPIRESFPGAWQRNITIEPTSSLLAYPPVYACVTRIAADIAKLGLVLLAMDDNNPAINRSAPKSSPYWQVLRKPNGFQNRIQFVRHWLLCKLIFGNAYAVKVRDGRGMVQALYLLDPTTVNPLVTPDGGVYYSIGSDPLARLPTGMRAAPASEIIHDRGPTLWHPLRGIPPLFACALSGTLGLKIQRNAAIFFQNMSRPSGLLTAPGTINEPTAERLKREWNENFSGENLGKLAVLGDGLDYKAMSVAFEQSQVAEQLGISAVDVATAFHMPAYKINQGPMPTSNNVQALNQQYYSDTLQEQIEDIELCLQEGLEVMDGYTVEFDLDGLLRMDSLTQMDVLTKGVAGAILKPDEAREKLNREKVKGGGSVYLQQQNYSLEALAKRDAREDPFATTPKPASAPPAPPAAAPPAAPADAAKAAEAQVAELVAKLYAAEPVAID